MTFINNKHLYRNPHGALNRRLIHENPKEEIQGGSPNEHYHLTEYEHDRRLDEPMFIAFDRVLSVNGDIMMGNGGTYAT